MRCISRWLAALQAVIISCLGVWPDAAAQTVFSHGPRQGKRIALSFDACYGPTAGYDRDVIQVLLDTRTEASLFLSGAWVRIFPDETRFLARQKLFELGGHGYWHLHLPGRDDQAIRAEIRLTGDLLLQLTGVRPHLFRAPYAEINDQLIRLAGEEGAIVVQYDVASGDSDPHLKAEAIVKDLLARTRSGSVVLFHMNKHGRETARILRDIIPRYRSAGFDLVKVSALMRKETPNQH